MPMSAEEVVLGEEEERVQADGSKRQDSLPDLKYMLPTAGKPVLPVKTISRMAAALLSFGKILTSSEQV